jgi:hypothetical protein
VQRPVYHSASVKLGTYTAMCKCCYINSSMYKQNCKRAKKEDQLYPDIECAYSLSIL